MPILVNRHLYIESILSKCCLIPGGGISTTLTSVVLVNEGALKILLPNELHIYQYMGKVSCVECRSVHLKFHAKYRTYPWKDTNFIHRWKFKSSAIEELVCVFETLTPCQGSSTTQHPKFFTVPLLNFTYWWLFIWVFQWSKVYRTGLLHAPWGKKTRSWAKMMALRQ